MVLLHLMGEMESFSYKNEASSPSWRPWVAGLGLFLFLASTLLVVSWFRCGLRGCPSLETLQPIEAGPDVVLADRYGEPLAEWAADEPRQVTLDELPSYVPLAFLAVEDQRYRYHHGVDWLRVAGALWVNLREGGVEQGSSTIPMQLARNAFPDQIPRPERTLRRKLVEARVAQEIESRFSKQEILELYLNLIPFGRGARGIDAASLKYFGHGAEKLTLPEAALLAALLKAPTYYDPLEHPDRARQRRNLVLDLMQDQDHLTPRQAETARRAALGVYDPKAASSEPPLAPYFVDRVEQELRKVLGEPSEVFEPGRRVRIVTTLDRALQRAAQRELADQLRRIEEGAYGSFQAPSYAPEQDMPDDATEYLQGAVVALDAARGEVLAWVGGRDYRQSTFDRVAGVQRPVGSAFKPFVLATALNQGHYLSERVSDRPLRIPMDDGTVWSPSNFAHRYSGEVTLREALVYSKNVAAVRLLQETGTHNVRAFAHRLGLPGDLPNVPALALGVASLSPLELATAYVPFATNGEAARPHTILRVEYEDTGKVLWEADPKTPYVLDARIAYLVTDVLADVVDRGTARAVRTEGFSGQAAGKTGTTNHRQDAWFVGYTPEVVSSIWIGFDQPKTILPNATGGRLAAPVWGRMMRTYHEGRELPEPWLRPPGIVEKRVDADTGFPLPESCPYATGDFYDELFLLGSVPQTTCPDLPMRWTESRDPRLPRTSGEISWSWSRRD